MGWGSEEKLKLLEPVEYNAPNGFFDLAASGEAAPAPVMELEDGSVRMDVFRSTLAGLVGQHVFLCACAIGGYQMKEMGLELPGFVLFAAAGAALVVYGGMWMNMQGWPLNVVLLGLFSLCFGVLIADSVGSAFHELPDLIGMFTIALVLMLLYSMPSFCCDIGFLDIKNFSGIIGYCVCIGAAAIVGLGAAMKAHPDNPHHAAVPVLAGAVWMLAMLFNIHRALGMYRVNHIVPQIIFAWVWPLDSLWIGYQKVERWYLSASSGSGV